MTRYFYILFFLATFAFVGESRNLAQIIYTTHYSIEPTSFILEDSKFPARYEDEVFTRIHKADFSKTENENLVELGDDEELDPIDFFDSLSSHDILRNSQKQKAHPLQPHDDVQMSINQKKVDIFIRLYTQRKRKAFLTGLRRAPQYYKMVQRIFANMDYPTIFFILRW